MGLLSGIKRLAGYQEQTTPPAASTQNETDTQQTPVPENASPRRHILGICEDGRLRMFEGSVPVYPVDSRVREEKLRRAAEKKKAVGAAMDDDERKHQPRAIRNLEIDPVVGFVEEGSVCSDDSSPGAEEVEGASPSSTLTPNREKNDKRKTTRRRDSVISTTAAPSRPPPSVCSAESASSCPPTPTADMNDMRRNHELTARKRVPASHKLNLTREDRVGERLTSNPQPPPSPAAATAHSRTRQRTDAREEERGRKHPQDKGQERRENANAILANFARWEWSSQDDEEVPSVPALVHSTALENETPIGRNDLLMRAEALRRAWNEGKDDGIKSLGETIRDHLRAADERWGGDDGSWQQESPSMPSGNGVEGVVADQVSPKAPSKGKSLASPVIAKGKGRAYALEGQDLAGKYPQPTVRDDTYDQRLASLEVDPSPDADVLLDTLDACFGPTLLNRKLSSDDGDADIHEDERRNRTLASFGRSSPLSREEERALAPFWRE